MPGAAKSARLRWRCRRGMQELDVLMDRFLAEQLSHLSGSQLATLDRLLDASDPDIMDWLLGRRAPAEPDFLPLLDVIRAGMRPARES